jgi:hypothetical protein
MERPKLKERTDAFHFRSALLVGFRSRVSVKIQQQVERLYMVHIDVLYARESGALLKPMFWLVWSVSLCESREPTLLDQPEKRSA